MLLIILVVYAACLTPHVLPAQLHTSDNHEYDSWDSHSFGFSWAVLRVLKNFEAALIHVC